MPAFGGLLRDPIGSTLYWEIKSRWQEFNNNNVGKAVKGLIKVVRQ